MDKFKKAPQASIHYWTDVIKCNSFIDGVRRVTRNLVFIADKIVLKERERERDIQREMITISL